MRREQNYEYTRSNDASVATYSWSFTFNSNIGYICRWWLAVNLINPVSLLTYQGLNAKYGV